MCLAQGPQRSDAGEPQTCSLSVSSQALYHWGTTLPQEDVLSINELIDKEQFSLSYVTLDNAINLILKYSWGAIMNKFDLG